MFFNEIAEKLQISGADFISPRITVLGRAGVSIEGHRGLLYFSDGEIRLKIKGGSLTVTGESLKLIEVSEAEAVVSGRIKAVAYA